MPLVWPFVDPMESHSSYNENNCVGCLRIEACACCGGCGESLGTPSSENMPLRSSARPRRITYLQALHVTHGHTPLGVTVVTVVVLAPWLVSLLKNYILST